MVNFQISDNPIHYTTRLQEQLRPFLHLLQCTSVFSICKWWVLRSGLLPQSSSACWTLPASWPSRLWWLCGEGRGKEATITECLLCARLPARRWMHLISFNLSRAIPSLFSWLRELNHIFFFFRWNLPTLWDQSPQSLFRLPPRWLQPHYFSHCENHLSVFVPASGFSPNYSLLHDHQAHLTEAHIWLGLLPWSEISPGPPLRMVYCPIRKKKKKPIMLEVR